MVEETPLHLAQKQFFSDYHGKIEVLGMHLSVCSDKGKKFDTIDAIISADKVPLPKDLVAQIEKIIPKTYSHGSVSGIRINISYQSYAVFHKEK